MYRRIGTDEDDVAGAPADEVTTLRELVRRHSGTDPGPLARATMLDDLALWALPRSRLVAWLEWTHGFALPADLVAALDALSPQGPARPAAPGGR